MTGRIDITCSLPAPTLAQVRAWLTRTGWEVDTSPLAQALDNERWSHPVHGRAWVPREELVDWLPYVSNWIANRAWQIEATPEAVYREIVGPGAAEARIAELDTKQTPSGPRGFRWSKPYRNRFEAGGKDAETCARLVELGLMEGQGNWHWVTERGKAVATEGFRWGRKWGYEL